LKIKFFWKNRQNTSSCVFLNKLKISFSSVAMKIEKSNLRLFFKTKNSYLFNEFVCNFGFFWHEWTSLKLEWNESFKGPRVPKQAQITQERVEYNVFLFNEPLKGSKSLKIFKISLTFHFDKLSNLSKSVHTGENSQVLTVSNKKKIYIVLIVFLKWFVPVFVLFKSSHK
jgi:hypothetical protein